jgi:hypothetical protein
LRCPEAVGAGCSEGVGDRERSDAQNRGDSGERQRKSPLVAMQSELAFISSPLEAD